MSRVFTGFLAVAMAASFVTNAMGQAIDIAVLPAYAPRGPQSPSWDEYVANANGAIELGVGSVGHAAHVRIG